MSNIRYRKIVDGVVEWYHNRIILDGMQIFNPTEEQLLAAGYERYEIPVHVRTLEDAKMEKLQALSQFDSSTEVNSFTLGDKSLWVSPNERTNYLLTLEAAKDANIENIPFMGYTIPVDTAISVLKAVSIYAMQCVGVTDAHRDAINALDSIEAVDAYDFEQGYPEKLVFNLE